MINNYKAQVKIDNSVKKISSSFFWPYHRPHTLESTRPPPAVWEHWPFYHSPRISEQTKHHWSKILFDYDYESSEKTFTFAVVIFCLIRFQFLDFWPAMRLLFISICLFFWIISSLNRKTERLWSYSFITWHLVFLVTPNLLCVRLSFWYFLWTLL